MLPADVIGVECVVIGGWAVYLYTNAQKSEDVDLAIGYESLNFFKPYGINEYEGLKIKYSVVNGTTVDLFIEEYSDKELPLPVRDIIKEHVLIGNKKVVNRELLLLLKLWGYLRFDDVKLRKDIIDTVSLLFYSHIDLEKFRRYTVKYGITKRRSSDVLLKYLDKAETLFEYICETKAEYLTLREKYKKEIKVVFKH